MLQKLSEHIQKELPFLYNSKLLIAISGGLDSVVLTHLLHQLKLGTFALAHCNFKLREEASDLDEEFVVELGKTLNAETHTIQFNTQEYADKNKLSIQLAARELRYSWFQELVKEHKYDYVLTAHHADDNLETFIINLSRGTGLEGLTGIPSKNGNIIRPLLPFSREEIEFFAQKNNLNWREDASNNDTKYLRNKVRHLIIPELKKLNNNFLDSFSKTTKHLQESQQIIDDKIAEIRAEAIDKKGNLITIDIKKIVALKNPKAYLYQLLKEYNFTEWNDVYDLLFAQSGKQILTKSHILLKDRDFLLLLPTNKNSKNQNKTIFIEQGVKEITKPINLCFDNVLYKDNAAKNCIYVDEKLVSFPLILRKWQHGDEFYPTGMKGKKKLSKYFKDEKISVFEKQNIWLLCSNKNEVLWILEKRQDRRFLPTNKTTKLLRISIK